VVLLLSSTCLPALPSAACLPAADGWPANPPAFAEAQRRVYSSSSVRGFRKCSEFHSAAETSGRV